MIKATLPLVYNLEHNCSADNIDELFKKKNNLAKKPITFYLHKYRLIKEVGFMIGRKTKTDHESRFRDCFVDAALLVQKRLLYDCYQPHYESSALANNQSPTVLFVLN